MFLCFCFSFHFVVLTRKSLIFLQEAVDFLAELDLPFIKVASLDTNNMHYLKHAAAKNKPLVISTGNHWMLIIFTLATYHLIRLQREIQNLYRACGAWVVGWTNGPTDTP